MPTKGAQFSSDDDDRPEYAEYRTLGDEPMKHIPMGYVPSPPNYNKEERGKPLPGKSLYKYYNESKRKKK